MNKIIFSSLLAISAMLAVSTIQAEDRKGSARGGKPPAEAFEACVNKSASDSCSFTAPQGEVSGTCLTPPHGGETLICAPERKRTKQ